MQHGPRDATGERATSGVARALQRAWGFLALGDDYLSSLEEDTLLERALGSRRGTQLGEAKRDAEEASRDLHARADAHTQRLGAAYRGRLYSEAVSVTVSSAQHAEEASNLLMGLKQAQSMLEVEKRPLPPPPPSKVQGPAISGLRPIVREENEATPVTLPATPLAVLGRIRPR